MSRAGAPARAARQAGVGGPARARRGWPAPSAPRRRRRTQRTDHRAAGPAQPRPALAICRRQVDDAVGDDDVDACVRERQRLAVALDELGVSIPGGGSVGACQRQHLVGHVQADRAAAGCDPARADEDIGSGARAEIEDDVAVAQVGDGGRHAAAKRRRDRSLGARRRGLDVVVQGAAEDLVAAGVRRARGRRAARRARDCAPQPALAPPAIEVAAAA
ncbi:MAG: hypothetical protein QOK16_3511 [Solirubrobacteraceae bacterium]|nr:hypothetical protein [Solirubrobacteraceae bacterium]